MDNENNDGLNHLFAVDSGAHSTLSAIAYNVAAFIERSFDEALPYQYLREFVVNAIEALATLIIIEPDWIFIENLIESGLDPIYRWTLWDDGVGMNPEQLLKFHHMFHSSKSDTRGRHTNFGMGGKIAALPINPAGMIVMSWQNGVGSMIVFHQNETDGQYGLYRQHAVNEFGDAIRVEVAPTPEAYDFYYDEKGCRVERTQGTLVIFKGASESDHTYLGPTNRTWEAVQTTIRTNTLELNKRFAKLNRPNLKVYVYGPAHKDEALWARCRADASGTVEEGHALYKPRSNKQPRYGQYRLVQGCTTFFDEACSHQGTLDISDGKIHWWLFDHIDPKEFRKKDAFRIEHGLMKAGRLKLDDGTGLYNTYQRGWDRHSYTPGPGVLAVLYKGELYDMRAVTDSGCHHMFNYFGIYDKEVRKRVVIIVEPNYTEDSGVWPNAVRSGLDFDGRSSLPWDSWGTDFAANMPSTIKEVVGRGGGQFRDTSNFHDRVMKTVAEIGKEYGLYTGPRARGPKDPNAIPKPRKTVKNPRGKRKPTVRTGGGAMPSFDIIDALKSPDAARPASYNMKARKLVVFASHHIFQKTMQRWKDRFAHMPGSESIIEDTVLEVYSGMLMARIIHVLGLKGRDIYDDHTYKTMLSDAALVTAVAGFFDADVMIQAKLNGKLGSHKKAAKGS